MQYEFIVNIPNGLHARPCAQLVEILKEFQPLQIICNGKTVDSLSILELLLLKINQGATISINCQNPLPDRASVKLKMLFDGV